jgi:hypothetical protein
MIMDNFIELFNNLKLNEKSDDQIDSLINDLNIMDINQDNKMVINHLLNCLLSLKNKNRCCFVEENNFIPKFVY